MKAHHAQGVPTLASNRGQLFLDALELHRMASGHLCLYLSKNVSWWKFPEFAICLLSFLQGSLVSCTDGPDLRIWVVSVGETVLNLVFDDHPQMVSFESGTDSGDRLLELLHFKVDQQKGFLS